MAIYQMPLSGVRNLPAEPGHGLPEGVILPVSEWADGMWDCDWESLEELVENIKANGQQTPVCVIDGIFLDGLHRVAALTELGASEVAVCDGKDGEYEPGGILADQVHS